jgi:hypothetical protein
MFVALKVAIEDSMAIFEKGRLEKGYVATQQ